MNEISCQIIRNYNMGTSSYSQESKVKSEDGFAWIPLDPSFKQYEYHGPIVNLTEAMGINATAFLDVVMNQSDIQQQMENYTNGTLEYLQANNMSNATLNDLLGYRTIIIPYTVIEKVDLYSEVPDDRRHKTMEKMKR